MAKNWYAVSQVTDAGGTLGVTKEYHVLILDGTTHATITGTLDYFTRRDFQGAKTGDRIKVQTLVSTVTYLVSPTPTGGWLLTPDTGSASPDDQTAAEVIYTPPATGTLAAAVELQTALDTLSAAADASGDATSVRTLTAP